MDVIVSFCLVSAIHYIFGYPVVIRKVIGRKISRARVTARTIATMSFSEA